MTDHTGSGVHRRAFLAGTAATLSLGVAGCLGNGDKQRTLGTPTSTTGAETTGETGTETGTGTATGDTLPTPIAGDPNADVTLIVFEDFACPHCQHYSLEVAPKIFSKYTESGKIRYEFHDFPIPVDPTASWEAASAARAVQAERGAEAFFQYGKALFEAQSDLGPDTYERLADEQGLDGAKIRQAAVEQTYKPTVTEDRNYGEQAGVRGTPTVAVNRQVVRPTVSDISDAIDSRLG